MPIDGRGVHNGGQGVLTPCAGEGRGVYALPRKACWR